MRQYFEIPVDPIPQKLTTQMAGKTWNLVISWNTYFGRWVIDFIDAQQVPVLQGIPLVTGVDLLGQHQHLGFGGSLVVQSDSDPFVEAEFTTLGVSARLYFVVGEP